MSLRPHVLLTIRKSIEKNLQRRHAMATAVVTVLIRSQIPAVCLKQLMSLLLWATSVIYEEQATKNVFFSRLLVLVFVTGKRTSHIEV